MEDPLSWPASSDLQGIMVGHDGHPDLSDLRPSGLALGDSASNPLLDLHLGSDLALDAHGHPSFVNQWSAEPQDFYYSHYPSRLTGDQDAWTPLQVTGVPHPPVSHMNIPPVGGPDCGFSKPHYSPPSESGSQYMGSFHSADSGYGSNGCATHSVVTSSYGMDSMSSPQISAKEHSFGEQMPLFDQTQLGPASMLPSDLSDSQLDILVKCDHPACSWVGKCPSDKRKHEARHRKLFKCDEPGCPRKEGFGTINDLARHKKCVHNKEPERGPKMMYMCFGKNCPRPDKRWPRQDNFKQHLNRMHGEEDGDALLRKSMDWYESVIGRRVDYKLEDIRSQDEPMVEQQGFGSCQPAAEMDIDSGDYLSSRAPTPRPSRADPVESSLVDSQSSQYPALASFGLTPSLANDRRDAAPEHRNSNPEAYVSGAADNLINAMTKMMNSRGRRPSQHSDEGIDVEPENDQLSQPQRQMLQKVLSVALERLSDDGSSPAEPSDDKQGWFQCDICSKRTRLRCEMKKHQKRHERPYGCTFPHCAKSFGSKADWKRHEISQHLNVQSWFCPLQENHKAGSCGQIFHREDTYAKHLSEKHRVSKPRVMETLQSSRLDLAGQSHFWCGFCNHSIALRRTDSDALDERFNHIDIEHLKKGERGSDWQLPGSSAFPSVVMPKSEASQVPEGNRRKRKCLG